MKILFASTPALGHLLPMLPTARAAAAAGHEVALLTHPSVAGAAPWLPLLPAGADLPTLLANVVARTGKDPIENAPEVAVEFFVGSSLNLGERDAVAAARQFAPDLVVSDFACYLGQLAATDQVVPWVAHGASLPLPDEAARQFHDSAQAWFGDHGFALADPIAYLDPWPDILVTPDDHYPAERVTIRPEPHSADGFRAGVRSSEQRPDGARRRVLVTLGTVVDDPDLLADVIASVARQDVDLRVAGAEKVDVAAIEGIADATGTIEATGFAPMAELLADVDVVVSAGGAGTVLSVLSAGLPLVLLPLGLDKPMNADRVASVGAGEVAASAGEVGDLVGMVLADDSYRTAAREVMADMQSMHTPTEALAAILESSHDH